jgi:hypothetical protein
MVIRGFQLTQDSSIRTQADLKLFDESKNRNYTDTMADYLSSNFPDEGLGSMNETQWRRAPGLFRIPSCDWATWRWNYENWSLSKKPSKDRRCAAFPCCPMPARRRQKRTW